MRAPVVPSNADTIEAALKAAVGLTGMQVVFLSEMTPEMFTFAHVRGSGIPGLSTGYQMPRADSFCARMLSGAPTSTANAAEDPAYADSPFRSRLGVVSYVGVPVVNEADEVIGTLCAMDTRSVPVSDEAIVVLRALADVIADLSTGRPGVRVRRAAGGWQVEGATGLDQPVEDLTTGMCLADLFTADLIPSTRPSRQDAADDEVSRLRTQVAQLEHALAARVVVEQAIGVLSERHSVPPREAFEQLRRVARSRGQKVHDLARAVVASAPTQGTTALPSELR